MTPNTHTDAMMRLAIPRDLIIKTMSHLEDDLMKDYLTINGRKYTIKALRQIIQDSPPLECVKCHCIETRLHMITPTGDIIEGDINLSWCSMCRRSVCSRCLTYKNQSCADCDLGDACPTCLKVGCDEYKCSKCSRGCCKLISVPGAWSEQCLQCMVFNFGAGACMEKFEDMIPEIKFMIRHLVDSDDELE